MQSYKRRASLLLMSRRCHGKFTTRGTPAVVQWPQHVAVTAALSMIAVRLRMWEVLCWRPMLAQLSFAFEDEASSHGGMPLVNSVLLINTCLLTSFFVLASKKVSHQESLPGGGNGRWRGAEAEVFVPLVSWRNWGRRRGEPRLLGSCVGKCEHSGISWGMMHSLFHFHKMTQTAVIRISCMVKGR